MTTINQRGHCTQPDGAAAKHHNPVSGTYLGLIHCVHSHGEGFSERSDIERDVIRNPVEPQLRLSHPKQRSEAPEGTTAAVFADVGGGAGLYHYSVTNSHCRDLRPNPFHRSRHLVAETHWLRSRTSDPTHLDVAQVAATDSAGCDTHEGISWARLGVGNLVDSNIAGAMNSHL